MIFETTTDAAQTVADNLLKAANNEFARMVQEHRTSFNTLWHHPEHTPEVLLQRLGTNATLAMQLAWARVQFILSVDPSALQPSEYTPPTLVYHQDGTVTIGD